MRIYASEWQRKQTINNEKRQLRNRVIAMVVLYVVALVIQAW